MQYWTRTPDSRDRRRITMIDMARPRSSSLPRPPRRLDGGASPSIHAGCNSTEAIVVDAHLPPLAPTPALDVAA